MFGIGHCARPQFELLGALRGYKHETDGRNNLVALALLFVILFTADGEARGGENVYTIPGKK
jgi:hypothetical protein